MTFSWISICLNRSSPARIDLFVKHPILRRYFCTSKFKALPAVTHEKNNSTCSPLSDILPMKNLKNATVNRNVFVKRCPQGPKLKQNRTEIELQIKVMTNVYSCFRICTNLVVSAQEKKIQICNSNLIIRQILLVFDILTVFDETEIISEFIMAALRNV